MSGTNEFLEFKNMRKKALLEINQIINISNCDIKLQHNFVDKLIDFFKILFPTIFLPNYVKLFKTMILMKLKVCSICLCDISKDEEFITECSHYFHEYCLNTWLSRSNTCPYCRTQILE